MVKVSVIVPNYNHASYLQQRIDSILTQTYQDFELILLDDCSTDESREILLAYENHPKVTNVIFNDQNSGSTFKQWDRGIRLAKGEYIWIAESDDWCEPTLLETIMSGFELYPNTILGYVQSYYVVGNNQLEWVSIQPFLETVEYGNSFIRKNLLYGNSIFNASMAVFKKSVYFNISHEYTKFFFCGDWLFWANVASIGDVFISGKILNYFRNQSGDVSAKSYFTGNNFLEELKVLFVFKDKKYITDDDFYNAILRKYHSYKNVINSLPIDVCLKIESLFFDDIHTKQLKKRLLNDYREAQKSKLILRLINKIKTILKKF